MKKKMIRRLRRFTMVEAKRRRRTANTFDARGKSVYLFVWSASTSTLHKMHIPPFSFRSGFRFYKPPNERVFISSQRTREWRQQGEQRKCRQRCAFKANNNNDDTYGCDRCVANASSSPCLAIACEAQKYHLVNGRCERSRAKRRWNSVCRFHYKQFYSEFAIQLERVQSTAIE